MARWPQSELISKFEWDVGRVIHVDEASGEHVEQVSLTLRVHGVELGFALELDNARRLAEFLNAAAERAL